MRQFSFRTDALSSSGGRIAAEEMTLIALAVSPSSHQLFAASDILITDDGANLGDRNILPLQSGLAVPFSQTFARRIMSKAVVFGNFLFLWAGSVYLSRLLCEQIMAARPASAAEFRKICKSFEDSAKSDSRFHSSRFECVLYHYDGEWVWGEGYPARINMLLDNVFLRAGGTGSEEFVRNFRAQELSSSVATRVIGAVTQSIVRELTERAHSYDVFGGGYEFFRLAKEGGFARVPYSISEVSRVDHTIKKYLGWFQVSRLIQCIPLQGGSLYLVARIPSMRSESSPQLESFFVESIGLSRSASPGTLQMEELDWDVEFSINIMIGDWTLSQIGYPPCAKLKPQEGKWRLEFDDQTKESLSIEYWGAGGYTYNPNAPEVQLICSRCGHSSTEQYYIERDDPVSREVSTICDACYGV